MIGELLLAVGAVIVAPLLGGLLTGIDRKLSARLQGRVGPPIIQPYYDAIKLLSKELIVTTRAQAVFVWGYLLLTISAMVMFAVGQDLLVIVFVLGFGGVCFIAGGFSTKSPYSIIGSQREVLQMMAYEPVLILFAVAVFLVNGSKGGFLVSSIVASGHPLLLSLPLVFLALLVVLLVKMRKSPFDFSSSHHAHQEIVRGILTEYSGPQLALVEITHWYELVLVLAMIGLFWATSVWIAIVLASGALLFAIVVDNVSARLTWTWMMRTAWTFGVGLATINIGVLYVVGLSGR